MRRRSRHSSTSGAPLEHSATPKECGVDARSDVGVDEALRKLATLLARQAAREIFERECARDVNSGDLQ